MEDPLEDSEILYSGEGGDVERWLEPQNNSLVFTIACILLSITFYISYLCKYSSYFIIHLTFFHCLYFIHHFHYQSIPISI